MSEKANAGACLICDRIRAINEGRNKFFVAETETGFVVIGDHQFFRGYTLLLYKEHKRELHEVEPKRRGVFLLEMSEVAAAVFRAFRPKKLNYELLGNTDEHLHWHIIPRHRDDPRPHGPVWVIDKAIRTSGDTMPDEAALTKLKASLLRELKKSNILSSHNL